MSGTYRTTKRGKVIQDKDRKNMKPDRGCLNHGGCPWCEGNRAHRTNKREPIETERG